MQPVNFIQSNNLELYLAILLFAFTSAITPGPNNVMLMSSGLNYGVKRSLPHMFGVCLGFPVMVIIIGLGLGSVFVSFPITHTIIQLFGILYLLYLAWLIATAKPHDMNSNASKTAKPLSFKQAALFQWVNPKAWVMATGAMATYTTLTSNIYDQVGIIAFIFFIVAFPSALAWLVFGVALRRLLQNPRQQHIFNIIMALLLVGSIIPVILDFLRK